MQLDPSIDNRTFELYTFAEPAIKEFLVNNRVDLVDLLCHRGYVVSKGYSTDPAAQNTKDVVSIILASAAVAVAIQPVLKTILQELVNRPIVVTEVMPIAVTDTQGKVVLDESGTPNLQWVSRSRLLERTAESTHVSVSVLGLHFSYDSSPVHTSK